MGADAQRRIGKAQADILKQDLEAERKTVSGLERRCGDLDAKVAVLEKDRKASARTIDKLRAAAEKDALARAKAEENAAAAKRDKESAERALREVRREAAGRGKEGAADGVRLARALEDVEKHKAAAAKERSAARDAADDHRKERDVIEQKVRRLERQKTELLAAFKKQIRLIDVLKRQKVHMEAARCVESHHWFWGTPRTLRNSLPPSNRTRFPRFLDRPSSLPEFSTTGERVSKNSFRNIQVEGILNRLGFHTGRASPRVHRGRVHEGRQLGRVRRASAAAGLRVQARRPEARARAPRVRRVSERASPRGGDALEAPDTAVL